MNYLDHNAVTEGRKRVRKAWAAHRSPWMVIPDGRNMQTVECLARRLEGMRLHKRGRSNEAAWHLYPVRARDAFSPGFLTRRQAA